MNPDYPFSAVVGQDEVKRVLLLNAVDPGLGGVLIEGPRGMAKTTLCRALAELLPEGRFVDLPLGASEDRLLGSLDLEHALGAGGVRFSPGLLARAHGGVLYVDEVNLLPDHLVDLLLDVAASGVNVVERDGISHRHPARFVLVGTMNPDEGELRPQLLDRFALSVALGDALDLDTRMAISRARLAYEQDPHAFRQRHRAAQESLKDRLAAARQRLPRVELPEARYREAAERALAADVEGVRADLVMLRAARAHAAWAGRERVEADDLEAVAEAALRHRRRQREATVPPPPPVAGGTSPSHDREMSGGTNTADHNEKWGALPPEPVPIERAQRPVEFPSGAKKKTLNRPFAEPSLPGRDRARTAALVPLKAGRPSPARHQRGGRIDWPASIARAMGRPRRHDQLCRRLPQGRPTGLLVILLDASASTLRGRVLARAKGVAWQALAEAYQSRWKAALLLCQGPAPQLQRPPQRPPKDPASWLLPIQGGGGTPLARAVTQAQALLYGHARNNPNAPRRLLILSDGRSPRPPMPTRLPAEVVWWQGEGR